MDRIKYNPVPKLYNEAQMKPNQHIFNRKLYLNEGANYISTIFENGIKYESRPIVEHRDLNEYDDGSNIAWLNMTKI